MALLITSIIGPAVASAANYAGTITFGYSCQNLKGNWNDWRFAAQVAGGRFFKHIDTEGG